MPNIAFWHPQIVHFVIALSIVGVVARVISLMLPRGKASFVGPMAATLIVLAAAASVPAVMSGKQAHGPVERVPGAREAVHEHEEAGERARNLLLGLAALEILGLFLTGRPPVAMALKVITAVAGLGVLYQVYEAGDEGGKVVYAHAGGVGIRSGEAEDLNNLLTAGLYHNAMQARKAGNTEDASRWIEELARSRPGDSDAAFIGIESILEDRGDPRGTLAALDSLTIPAEDTRNELRRISLAARSYAAVGQADSGKALLEAFRSTHPTDVRLQGMVDRALQRLESSGR